MALNKRYAELPDFDPSAPEIYETPELTDDASTVQTRTLRTASPSSSDEERHERRAGLDRQRIDRDEARRRFEPSRIDATDVDFSDRIGGGRKSYKTPRRGRRRGPDTDEDLNGGSESEEETLSQKLARLRREAEEVRLELERREEDASMNDREEEDGGLGPGATELSSILDGLRTSSVRRTDVSKEDRFAKTLTFNQRPPSAGVLNATPEKVEQTKTGTEVDISTLSAIAGFSDRLTSLEVALGISEVPSTATYASILPTLATLSAQIGTLSSTLVPEPKQHRSNGLTTTTTSPIPNLDTITSRIRTLTAESDKLTLSRKAALQTLTDLHDARLRHASTTSSYSHYHHSRPNSSHQRQASTSADPLDVNRAQEAQLTSQLFLDEQAVKIHALYQTLPTIQELQPLLPVVLERLRTLSVLHAGAGDVRGEMDEIEQRQRTIGEEIMAWKEGVEGVERMVGEMEGILKGNVEVVSGMVKGVEQRVKELTGELGR